MLPPRPALLRGFLALSALWPAAARGAEPSVEDLEFFEKKVRPILVADCFPCHSTRSRQRGGLVLDSRAGLLGRRQLPRRRPLQAPTGAAPRPLPVGPRGPAPDRRRNRRLPPGRCARRLRKSGGPPVGLAALRRTLGPPLARPGPLRRDARPRVRLRNPGGVP